MQHGDGPADFSHDACPGIEGAKVMDGWGITGSPHELHCPPSSCRPEWLRPLTDVRVEAAWRLGKWKDLEEILDHVSDYCGCVVGVSCVYYTFVSTHQFYLPHCTKVLFLRRTPLVVGALGWAVCCWLQSRR